MTSELTFKDETYDDGSLRSRKTLIGHTMTHREGFLTVKRDIDKEIVFAGTYTELKKYNPLLEV